MRVHVDRQRCQGHSRCYDIAPEVFDVDELGNAFELGDGTVPAGMEAKARLAATNCPEHAIEVMEGRTVDLGAVEASAVEASAVEASAAEAGGVTAVDQPAASGVTDWATDFDHTDPQWVADPYPIWDDLRGRCPVAHSDRYGGTWLPVTHEGVAAVAYDTEHFTSRSVVVSNVRPGPLDLPAPIGLAPPITSDPPFHAMARRLLLPAFAPKRIAALEPMTRELCRELLDATAGRREFDASLEYAQHIPLKVIIGMLGFPLEDADIFRRFIKMVLEDVNIPLEQRLAVIEQGEIEDYITAQIDDHLAHPRDDLTSFLLEAELDGQKLLPEHVRGTMVLLMIAGIDTTWSAIGASLWHLGTHEGDRRRLAAEPDLLPVAMEELLRAYAPVTMARLVAKDVELGGRTLHEGDWLLLPFPAANRDPAAFDRAGEVVIDRADNRHAAFGLGIHRCLGSNLARMELRVALEEWLARYPDWEVSDPGAVTWSAGQVRGPRSIPVRILG